MRGPYVDESDRCALCNQPASALKVPLNVEIATHRGEEAEVWFCTWQHFSDWVGRGEPNYVDLEVDGTPLDKFLVRLVGPTLTLMLGLMLIGAWTLAKGVF